MAAVIQQDVDAAVGATGDDYRIEPNFTPHEIALVGNLRFVRYKHPTSGEDSLHFRTKQSSVAKHFNGKEALVQARLYSVAETFNPVLLTSLVNRVIPVHSTPP